MRRVVVTGMGGVTALGHDWVTIKNNLMNGITATRHMPEWSDIDGIHTQLAAPLQTLPDIKHWPRKKTRTMGPVAQYAVSATEQALRDANLIDNPVLQSGSTGIAYGSSFGSPGPMTEFCELLFNRSIKKLTSTSYLRMMGHTTAVNIGLFFGIKGRIIPSSTACTSGSLSIGYAAETIRYGKQDIMIAGGAEELCPSMASVFDVLYATSTCNDRPDLTPRPYDRDRDGLVIGEGAATLILEEYEHAKARRATIYAELVGFGTNLDGSHATQPSAPTMEKAMSLALEDANLSSEQIGFVSGHGTATEFGDITETIATYALFKNKVPFHSLKSYYGHTLGACGSMESWLAIEMMRCGWFAPTANLNNVDERCAPLDFIMDTQANRGRHLDVQYVMNNNFAFGGINTSLIFKRHS